VTIQGISAIALSLGAVKLMIESGDMSRAAEILESVSQELSVEATSLRQIMSDLRPPVLEERGLVPAVRDLADRLSRDAGIPVTVTAPPTVGVPPDLEILAYRVVQEALSNIAKHAEASSVNIRIDSDAGTLDVEIADDGSGFDTNDEREFLRQGRVGLASMRERAELASGTFVVRSRLGVGTTVMAAFPFDVLSESVPLR
jgi:two-component system NarL family sensor kinase